MRIESFVFGRIIIDGVTYEHDVVIDHGRVRKRRKKPSKKFRDGAYGNLPVMDDVKQESKRRQVELAIMPTNEAIKAFREAKHTNAVLHVIC